MDFHERQLERQSFTQRSLLVIAFLLIFIVVILFRTFSLQISNFIEFDKASLNNRTYSVPVQPLRGKILDRNGEIISENLATFDLVLFQGILRMLKDFLRRLRTLLILIKMRSIFTLKILILRHFLIESWFLKEI